MAARSSEAVSEGGSLNRPQSNAIEDLCRDARTAVPPLPVQKNGKPVKIPESGHKDERAYDGILAGGRAINEFVRGKRL